MNETIERGWLDADCRFQDYTRRRRTSGPSSLRPGDGEDRAADGGPLRPSSICAVGFSGRDQAPSARARPSRAGIIEYYEQKSFGHHVEACGYSYKTTRT